MLKYQRRKLIVICAIVMPVFNVVEAKNISGVKNSVRISAIIKARPTVVWSTIHESGVTDPTLKSTKVLSQDEHGVMLEQKFAVPFLGETTSVFCCTDPQPNRLDYRLVKSDVFKVMDGSWTVNPMTDGLSTKLELSCFGGLKGVFPEFMVRMILKQKLEERLSFVKKIAEKRENQLAQKDNSSEK